jgi:hypothetical protein
MTLSKRNYFVIILMGCLFFWASCGDDSSSDRSHPEFTLYSVGSGGISARFGSNVNQVLDNLRGKTDQLDDFLFTIAEEPLTINQIRERSGLAQTQVEYFISNIGSCNIIKKYNQNQWATTLPVITDNQMKIIRKDLAPMANSVAQYLKKEIHQIRTLYTEVKSPLDASWEDISHLIISKFIIDGTFHSHLNRLKGEKDVSELDSREMTVIPAFFLQKGGNNSNFGCNWYVFNEGDDQREVYVLHGAIFDRYDIAMNKYRRDQYFSACLFKISQEAGIHSLTDREKAMLRDLDWISGDRLLVPIVEADTVKSLLPMIENIGKDAAEVAFAKFQDITDSYNKSTYSKFLDNDEDYIQALIHSLFSLTIERLMRISTLPQIPVTVPESLGVYFVFGKLF